MAKPVVLHGLRYASTNMDGETDCQAYCGLHTDSDCEWTASYGGREVTCKTCIKAMAARHKKFHQPKPNQSDDQMLG